ncbi:MAG: Tetratricopeptide 2 repeat protein, partial [Bryobacterales bacterium]|nr:Tetratricopeptide 2 repeat protein [Bryobacterales bacterium]
GYDLLGIAEDGLGHSADAENAFRQALQLNPQFLPAHNDLGRNLYRAGRKDAASAEFQTVLKIDPQNFTANYNLGLIARDAKGYEESAKYLEAARERLPSDAATLLALTGAYLAAGRAGQANRVSQQLVALSPNDPQIRFSLGALMLEWKQYADAAEHLERARAVEPKNFEVLHDVGQAYLHLKNFSQSEQAFLQALAVRPDSVDTLYQLAVLYAEQGHPDQAIQVLVRARQYAPARPDVLLLLGREAIDEGFLDDAVEVLTEAVRIGPGKIEPHLLLGEALTRKKFFDQALAEYETVLKIAPSNPQSYVGTGRTLLYMRRYPEAEQALYKALALDRASAQAAYYMGLVAADKADYTGAQRWFEQALRSDPQYFPALYDMGVNCARQDDYARARDFLERAKMASPSFAQVYYRLSNVYRRLKDPERAAQNFGLFKKYEERDEQRRNYYPQGVLDFVQQTQDLPESERLERYRQQLLHATETKPDDLNVWFMLAQVSFRTGREQEAMAHIGKIVSFQPDSPPIRMRTASLLTAFHHYSEAAAELRAVVAKHPDAHDANAARFALAALYGRMDRTGDALELLQAHPDNTAGYHNLLGRVLLREGQAPRGLKELERAATSVPEREEYVVDLILEQAASGELNEAAKALQSAKAKWPASGRVRLAEAFFFERHNRLDDAVRAYQQAADLSGHWEAPYLGLGRVRGSTDILDQAADLFPASPWPHWFKALLLRKKTPGSEAAEVRRALALAGNQPAVYRAMLADALYRDDCAAAREIWARVSALGIAEQLNPASWCSGDRQASKQMLDRYSESKVFLEIAREETEN